MSDGPRTYSNDDVTVIWAPDKCTHSGKCFSGLKAVFDPRRRPWVNLANATTEQIIAQVKQCPSGALSLSGLAPSPHPAEAQTEEHAAVVQVDVSADGPLLVTGPVAIRRADGSEQIFEKCALCRCGGSSNKPFCDGSHRTLGFTAS